MSDPEWEVTDPWWGWDTEDDDNWNSEFGGEDIRVLVRERNRLLAERDALAAVAEPYTGRIEAFDAVLSFLGEMPDADGLVERGDLQDYVTDLRSRATAARTVAKP